MKTRQISTTTLKLANHALRYVCVFGIAGGMLAGLGSSASGSFVDGFDVTFNPLPTMALSNGLPDSLSINGTSYTPMNLVYPVAGGIGGFSHQSFNPWGATSPFWYNPSLNGSVYDGIWDGEATYRFNGPQSSLSIYWGTIDANNALRFYGTDGAVIGTISGGDLATAAASDSPGYDWAKGVKITVQLAGTPFSSFGAIGGPNLTFEYANIAAVPEPSSMILLGIGLVAVLIAIARQRKKRGPADSSGERKQTMKTKLTLAIAACLASLLATPAELHAATITSPALPTATTARCASLIGFALRFRTVWCEHLHKNNEVRRASNLKGTKL